VSIGELVHIGTHAEANPERAAAVLGSTGAILSYEELDRRSSALAGRLAREGIGPGGRIAILMQNTLRYFEVAWAAQRSGLFYVPVNWHLTPAEAAYIVGDSGAQALVAGAGLAEEAAHSAVLLADPALRIMDGTPLPGWEPYLEDGDPEAGAFDAQEGAFMFYSSGTTGRPKGITRALTGEPFGTPQRLNALMQHLFGFDADSVYLCPAPLYHAAPLGWSMATQRMGGTVVLMERFDPVEMLELIERYRVTHVQLVPTMFVRLLKLPERQRLAHDLSSLRSVVHAAAPCPIEVKERMLEWWGPIIREYYAGSEGTGFCTIGSDEWLAHRGSVGRNVSGTTHIVGDDGVELPVGEVGTVWFEGAPSFEYHNDPEKTAAAFDEHGWSTLGDLGSIDGEGYLYLSDRRSNLILSGGVNIYPQEVENLLALHPDVADVAVIGVPDAEMGQRVLAVVSAADARRVGPELAAQLLAYCRGHLAHFKCPRDVVFDDDLPRLPTGKLAKRLLVDRYG
jgi:long-chain acyl-CoA synthetase